MTPPALVYLGMGLVVARVMLDRTQTRGMTWLQWLQFLVDALRIVMLWPLVLFVEKIGAWLKDVPEGQLYPVKLPFEEPYKQILQVEPPGGEER
jgi:hypothetical protein